MTVGKKGEQRQQVKKTYGKIIYRGTMRLTDMAEHIMKHGSIYTEDVVIGVITKLKSCMQEMLADGYKVKLDGIGTLYPVLTSKGVADAASAMRQGATLSTQLYSELTGEETENGNTESGNNGGTENGGGSSSSESGNGGGPVNP